MKLKLNTGFIFAAIFVGSFLGSFLGSFAQAETAVYKGDLNGAPLTLTIEVSPTKLDAHYIPCQQGEKMCDGPGIYAFFARAGQATVEMASVSNSVPVNFAYYVGAENTANGKLNGSFSFVDRTGVASKVNGVTFYEDSILQNKIEVGVSGLTAQTFAFPSSYTLNWDNHDDEIPSSFSSGRVVLFRQ